MYPMYMSQSTEKKYVHMYIGEYYIHNLGESFTK